jgi:hypothetical protein
VLRPSLADAERIGRWGATALCVVGVAWGCWARLTGVQRDLLFGDEFHSFKLMKTHERYAGGVEALTVLVVLGSGHLGAYVLAVGGALALVQAARRRDTLSWFLAAGVLGPAIALAALRPYGDAYAYARYLLPSAVLASWCVGRGLADCVRSRPSVRQVASVLPSLLMTGVVWAGGAPTDGPHGGSYLALVALPAFDVPWPERSSFYRALERERGATILEAPALMTQTRQLHRNAFLQHRCRTLLGFFPEEEPAWLPRGAYVSLLRDRVADGGADYLILHRDAGAEVRRYWDFVFKQTTGRDASTRALMERQRVYYGPLPRPSSCLVARLQQQLGVPAYQDADLVVWDLRRLRRVQGAQEVLQ